jgi:hypothetical protein
MLLGVLALSALVAPAARANEPTRAPEWTVEGKELSANETVAITAKIPAGTLILEGARGKLKVTCKEGKLASGSFIANQNEEAISETKPEFSSCKVEGNEKSGEKCEKVEEPIKAKTVRQVFVLPDESGKIGTQILADFDPRAGKEFVELKFPEAGCKLSSTQVTNLALASVWTDKTISEEETEIELGENLEGTSYVLKWPDSVASGESVESWSLTGKKFEPLTYEGLKAFSENATFKGELLIATTGDKKFGICSAPCVPSATLEPSKVEFGEGEHEEEYELFSLFHYETEITSISITPGDEGFEVVGGTCIVETVYWPNSVCSVLVAFKRPAPGARSAVLRVRFRENIDGTMHNAVLSSLLQST